MKRIALLSLALLFLISNGCTSLLDLSPGGDVVSVSYREETIRCELLTVDDSLLYYIPLESGSPRLPLMPGKIYASPPSLFSSVNVHGYANHDWVGPVVLMEVLPAVVIGIVYGVHDGSFLNGMGFTAALLAVPAVNIALLAGGTIENPGFESPGSDQLNELRMYARYPKALTAEQMQLLLSAREQEAPFMLEPATGGWRAEGNFR